MEAGVHSVVGLTPSQVHDLVHSIPKGHSGVVALVEHAWARYLHKAVLDAGGVMLAEAFVGPTSFARVGTELQAAMEAAAAADSAQAIEDET